MGIAPGLARLLFAFLGKAVAMAVPFRAAGGKVMGSLVVYGPSARLDDARVQQIVALLLDASRELSAKAGATTD